MLTSTEIEIIMTDHLNGREPRVKSEEADKFRAELDVDIAHAKEKDWVIDIPKE